jgi:hypothetical protein
MTYDPIDTNETDSTADGNIEAEGIDVANSLTATNLTISGLLNGADTSTAAAGEVLTSDGQGNANFAAPPELPSGAIIMWGGSINNIPSGFSLCDGSDGTPDLRDKFVIGAGSGESVGDTGGTSNQSVDINISGRTEPARFQGDSDVVSTTNAPNGFGQEGSRVFFSEPKFGNIREAGNDKRGASSLGVEPLTADFNDSDTDFFDNRPEYYAVAYIQKN